MNRVSLNHFVRVTWLFLFFLSKFKISNFKQHFEEFLSEKYFRNWNIFKKEIFHKNEQTLHNQKFSYSYDSRYMSPKFNQINQIQSNSRNLWSEPGLIIFIICDEFCFRGIVRHNAPKILSSSQENIKKIRSGFDCFIDYQMISNALFIFIVVYLLF